MAQRIRVILDTEENVIRDIAISKEGSLATLHEEIVRAFGFDGLELASFYRVNEAWEQGEEIPLMSMDGSGTTMFDCSIEDTFPSVSSKLLYIYDFMNVWTFYVELVDDSYPNPSELPSIVLQSGDMPKEAPVKEFKADALEDLFKEESDPLENFDSIEDYDF